MGRQSARLRRRRTAALRCLLRLDGRLLVCGSRARSRRRAVDVRRVRPAVEAIIRPIVTAMRRSAIGIRALVLLVLLTGFARPASATFSIIARDPATGEFGLAIASRVLSVRTSGSVAEADVGVVARQADWDTRYAR